MQQILLQNVISILLQNPSGFSLENATVLLPNTTVITKCNDFITKFNIYYKLRQDNYQMFLEQCSYK